MDWIESQIPDIVKARMSRIRDETADSGFDAEALVQAYVNIIAGACISLGMHLGHCFFLVTGIFLHYSFVHESCILTQIWLHYPKMDVLNFSISYLFTFQTLILDNICKQSFME